MSYLFFLIERGGWHQRVFNVLLSARLSRRRMIWLVPPPLHPSQYKLDRRHTGILRKRDSLLTGGGREGEGAKSYDGEKAWFSMIH
jgi:hypothetical protein